MKLMKFLDTLAPDTLIWLCTGDDEETDYIVLKEVHAFKFQEVRGYRVRRVSLKFRQEFCGICLAVVVSRKGSKKERNAR